MAINIALIRQEQTGGDGGAQAIIDLMIQALSENQQLRLSLLCRKWTATPDNANEVIIDPPFKGRTQKQSSFISALHDHFETHHYDLIQSHERFSGCHVFRAGDGVHKVWLQHKARISNPLQAWWLRHSSYHKALLKEEKAMFESPRLLKVICNSRMVQEEILEHFDIPCYKVCVIHNGVDNKRFTPPTADRKRQLRQVLNLPENGLVFIFPGSGFERKNLDTAIRAFSQQDHNCHLIVAGRDKREERYKALAKQLRCGQNIHFLGAQKRERMLELYQAADVLVLPTLYDPFPNVILEGMACGLPSITSTTCGARDAIVDSECGYVTQPLDWKAFAENMQTYQDSQRLIQHSQNALSAASQFGKERMQQQLQSLYKELLNN